MWKKKNTLTKFFVVLARYIVVRTRNYLVLSMKLMLDRFIYLLIIIYLILLEDMEVGKKMYVCCYVVIGCEK